MRKVEKRELSVIEEVDEILSGGWDECFSYDRLMAETKGMIVFRWKRTGVAIPLRIEVSQKALESGRLHIGTLRRNLKKFQPEYVLNQLASDVNYLLRNANRRKFSQVTKDLKKWIDGTAEQLKNMYGNSTANEFLKDVPLPSTIKRDTLQALHYLVEARVAHLKNL
jgi:hypothetical protein